MLTLKSLLYLPLPIPRRRLPFAVRSAAMSSAAGTPTVEHVVLFRVRPTADPSSMISNLQSLASLSLTSHLSVTPILRHQSPAATSLAFTHLLHARYPDKSALSAYSAHPAHVSVVQSHVLPICDDVMAVDWVTNIPGPLALPPGSAVRLSLVKPKEGVSAADVTEVISEAVVGQGAASQISCGENFSPGRAKGYEVGFLAVFPGVEELNGMDAGEVEGVKEKVRPLLESVIVVDYVIPETVAASL